MLSIPISIKQYGQHFFSFQAHVSAVCSFLSKSCHIMRVTDILKFYKILLCTYCKGFFLSIKNSHYAYIPPHKHKKLPTLGNEKEQ